MDAVVRRYLAMYVTGIGVNFSIDWYMWNLVMLIAMGGLWSSLGLSLAIAFFIGAVEWMILIQDPTENKRRFWTAIAVRVGFIAFLAVPTGTIYDLHFFAKEIAGEFDRQEKEGADRMREEVIANIVAEYAKRLEAKETSLASRPDEAAATIAANRATMVAAEQAEVDRVMAQKVAKSKEVATAARQMSGRRSRGGNKDAYVALQKQESDLRDELATLNATNVAALAKFDADSLAQKTGAVDSVQEATDAVLAKRDAEISSVRALTQQQLGDAYPGNWMVSRGVMDQYRTLGIVVARSPTNQIVALFLWGLGMTPPSLLLLMKLLAPLAVTRYTSLRAQAAAGNDEAKRRLAEMGYSGDLTHVAQTKDALTPQDLVDEKRIALREKLIKFNEWFFEECAPDGLTGISKSVEILTRLAVTRWNTTIAQSVRELSDVEAAARKRGVKISEWPSDWDVADPRVDVNDRPWLVGEDELVTQHGWVKPPATALRVVFRSVP